MRQLAILSTLLFITVSAAAQPVNQQSGEPFPVRGLSIQVPYASGFEKFHKLHG